MLSVRERERERRRESDERIGGERKRSAGKSHDEEAITARRKEEGIPHRPYGTPDDPIPTTLNPIPKLHHKKPIPILHPFRINILSRHSISPSENPTPYALRFQTNTYNQIRNQILQYPIPNFINPPYSPLHLRP